jgi:hypothetical protein
MWYQYLYETNKADACDIINYKEYEDIVNKVLEKKPIRAITIFVDMKDIKRNGLVDTEDRSNDDDKADISDSY